ncbi:MAG: PAS domain-containing protein [Alphaproteobacteria bacterium]|nr:PAS domain-containing protein [Alphaproteobacteria bacterium]
MAKSSARRFWRPARVASFDPTVALAALPDAVLVVGPGDEIVYVNPAAEIFFDAGAPVLCGTKAEELVPTDSPLLMILTQARKTGASVSEEGVTIETPRIGAHFVTLQASPLPASPSPDGEDLIVLMIHERSIARKIDRQLVHRGAARSVSAMAAMLAHEVKNPLSGIRGAAQLLEQSATNPKDRDLTRLICDETDRIRKLVDRMEVFSDARPIERGPVNIHQVLEHARKVAQTGFGRSVRFVETYDPSLPPVLGNRDQLVQVFLNLIKNAAEAVPEATGEIVLTTAYQHGFRMAMPGSDARLKLPLVVGVQDNGQGIPDDIRPHLFDPFVTTKVNGTGLGLALVAKIIGDHGGIIEFDSQPRRTIFRVMLPIYQGAPGRIEDESGHHTNRR